MKCIELRLFSTPLEINGENRFFPDNNPSKSEMIDNYFNFINTFQRLIITKAESFALNISSNFSVTLPFSFNDLKKFNYACILSEDNTGTLEKTFYFFKPKIENNSIGSCLCDFTFDYFIDNCYEISNERFKNVLKERSHISYKGYDEDRDINYIKNGTRILNTYSKPTIDEIVSPTETNYPYDILWFDVQLTRFKFQKFTETEDGIVAGDLEEFNREQKFSDGFSSTYHVFRPFKVYEKGTKNEIKNITFKYYLWSPFADLPIDTITNLSEIDFTDLPSNIVNVSLTFNAPFDYTVNQNNEIVINGFGSPIFDINNYPIDALSKYFIFEALSRINYKREIMVFDNLMPLSIPSNRFVLQSKNDIIDNSPLLRYSNLYVFNIIMNNSVIPIYTEKYTNKITVYADIYPKPDASFVKLTILDGDNNIVYNADNLPLILERRGTIPITISQYEAYKVANGNRIKANIIGKIASGAVTIGSLYATGGLSAMSTPQTSIVPYADHIPTYINDRIYPSMGETTLGLEEGSQTFSFNGERATNIMNTLATFADLKNLVTLTGQSAQNSMTDLVFQDRILFSVTNPVDKYCDSMYTFCREYQEYGAIINREDALFELFDKLDAFIYIKTVDVKLPLYTSFNTAINNIFNRGVRLWRCVDNVNIKNFNLAITNYEFER